MKEDWTVIYFDGTAWTNNPGLAAGAAIIDLPKGESHTVTVDLGTQTNNYAEYSGAIAGLKKALELGCKRIKVFGDSQLVIYQLSGKYKVKSDKLIPLYTQARKLLLKFEEYQLNWIPQNENSRAYAAVESVLNAKYPTGGKIPHGLPVSKPNLKSFEQKASIKEYPTNCPYCGNRVSLVDATVVYSKLGYGKLWLCENYPVCDSYVGAHNQDDSPLGTLANSQLREWRKNAHAAFDPLWKSGKMSRKEAYGWLCEQLGMSRKETHIGMFNEEQCKQVVQLCQSKNPV